MSYDQLNHAALAVMFAGLFGWLAATAMFIVRGFGSDGRPRFKKAIIWFAVIFVFIGVWIGGLLFLGYKA
jgi:hypothetical protein